MATCKDNEFVVTRSRKDEKRIERKTNTLVVEDESEHSAQIGRHQYNPFNHPRATFQKLLPTNRQYEKKHITHEGNMAYSEDEKQMLLTNRKNSEYQYESGRSKYYLSGNDVDETLGANREQQNATLVNKNRTDSMNRDILSNSNQIPDEYISSDRPSQNPKTNHRECFDAKSSDERCILIVGTKEEGQEEEEEGEDAVGVAKRTKKKTNFRSMSKEDKITLVMLVASHFSHMVGYSLMAPFFPIEVSL